MKNKAMGFGQTTEYQYKGGNKDISEEVIRKIIRTEINGIIERITAAQVYQSENTLMINFDEYENHKSFVHYVESCFLKYILKKHNHNYTKAAKYLGIDRKTLYNKLKAI